MKQVAGVYPAPQGHWVGDGFPVRSMFSYDNLAAELSPFLMLDYAGPAEFPPATRPPGVGQHPHRGFETVTIVYRGEVSHRDSTGQGGTIGPGDVQWMTAGAGILHDEFHSPDFTRTGGLLQMIQLWVNLPARDKMADPGYQAITDADIPVVSLPEGAGHLRIIAGSYQETRGPAKTFTPMNVWDLRLKQGQVDVGEAELVLFERAGETIHIEAVEDAVLLYLGGEPIDEPIVGYGPFVMNSKQEIIQAVEDFNSGKFGSMPAA